MLERSTMKYVSRSFQRGLCAELMAMTPRHIEFRVFFFSFVGFCFFHPPSHHLTRLTFMQFTDPDDLLLSNAYVWCTHSPAACKSSTKNPLVRAIIFLTLCYQALCNAFYLKFLFLPHMLIMWFTNWAANGPWGRLNLRGILEGSRNISTQSISTTDFSVWDGSWANISFQYPQHSDAKMTLVMKLFQIAGFGLIVIMIWWLTMHEGPQERGTCEGNPLEDRIWIDVMYEWILKETGLPIGQWIG